MSYTNALWSLSLRQISQLGILLPTIFLTSEVYSQQNSNINDVNLLPDAWLPTEQQSPITLYLEVFLNETRLPDLLKVSQYRDQLFVQSDDLKKLGFILNDTTSTDLNFAEQIALSSLPGLVVNYNVSTQQLLLSAPLSLLSLSTTKIWAGFSQKNPEATASPGVLLNYDLYFNKDNNGRLASAATEFRVFGFAGAVFSHTSAFRSQDINNQGWASESVALDTFAEWSFPEKTTRLIIGDSISGGLSWSRPLRLGGIQLSRNFNLQPYRSTAPITAFIGEATLPSSVELYIDGIRRYQSNVPTGPFELNTVLGITGAGQAQIITTDILGRSTTVDIPFYNTPQLLAKGLSDWTVNLGFVHENYGTRSFSYDNQLAITGSVRYGVSNNLTMEAHAESGGDLTNGGLGFMWQHSSAGVFSLSHSRSNENEESGHQTTWRYNWINDHFNFSANSQRTFENYLDIASKYGSLPPRASEQVLAGVHTPSFGNIGINATRLDYANSDEQPLTYGGVFWSNSFSDGVYLSFSYNQNFDDSEDRNIQFSFSINTDLDHHFNSTAQTVGDQNNYQVSLQRAMSDDNYGWRLQRSKNDNNNNMLAEGHWQGDYGRVSAGVARRDHDNFGYAQADGSLVWMNSQSFASRRIYDGFAVVSTNGIANIPVKLENRIIGHTNENGSLLVTRLNAWQRNKISIDPLDLPPNTKVTIIDKIVTPTDRAGTFVAFSADIVRAAIVLLIDNQGKPLSPASEVQLINGYDNITFIGFDGQVYLENLQDHNQLRVNTPNGLCYAEFDFPKNKDPSNYIGPIKCLASQE